MILPQSYIVIYQCDWYYPIYKQQQANIKGSQWNHSYKEANEIIASTVFTGRPEFGIYEGLHWISFQIYFVRPM